MKSKLFLISLFLITLNIFSQDYITKKDGEKLKVIIKEVNKNNIKYVDYEDPKGVLFTIDKVLVSEVKFAHGKNLDVKDPEEDALYFADDKLNNYMLNFSAFGGNTLGLAYERALKPGQSIMAEVKVYGLGMKPDFEDSRSGFGLDLYYRLKTKSLFSNGAYRPKHILHGAYFAPSVGFSSGDITYNDYYNYNTNVASKYSASHSIFHFGIQYGKQWILQRKVSIDASLGFHYYFGNDDSDENGNLYEPLRLGNLIGGDNKLFGFNIRIGFLGGKDKIVTKN